ncbi:RING finger 151-like [Paramuricea clavata]|uniref:RING finger 151-like n=1 Tax=Paramuricea clavata TaxID=317549 RepID=A0A7D9J7R1_PARCT|nr:RING finger 151-like [Paramuricea clavata]
MATCSTKTNTHTAGSHHFTCNICLEVLQDPVQCVKNEHYFCKKCITKHLTRSQTCPVCQDKLTPETLRPISRTVANILEQFQSLKCMYAIRGCTSAVRYEALLSHHEECSFAPVQCSREGCGKTVNRQDLVSHQTSCEFRSITCEDCHKAMRQREYGKHGCVLLKEIDKNRQGLAAVQKILREIREEQLRQGEEIQRLPSRESRQSDKKQTQEGDNSRHQASELRQPNATQSQRQQSSNSSQQTSQSRVEPDAMERKQAVPDPAVQSSATQGPRRKRCEAASASTDHFRRVRPIPNQATVDRKIVVAGGDRTSYEVFNWSTQKWSLYVNTLFFEHIDAFSFLYDNKIMICGGKDTNRVECLDIADNRCASTFPVQLPGTRCGKGVLCGDKILTFGQSVSATSLKPPFKTTVLFSYNDEREMSSYGVARVNANAVVLLGGYYRCKTVTAKEDVLLYNPITNVMKKLAPLPYELFNMTVVVHNNNIIILGGKKGAYDVCDDVLMYNITNQQCSRLPSMLEKRSRCAAVIMGDMIVVMGGNSRNAIFPLKPERNVNPITAEYLVLGEDRWKKLPPMHYERDGATACLLP